MTQTFPHWDTSPPKIPPRSRLYSLPLVGLGTPEVESLTGYLARLAHEHSLSPAVLLGTILRTSSESHWSISHYPLPRNGAYSINGFGGLSSDIVKVLERLTLRRELRFGTMQPWEGVLSSHALMRKRRAWCAACYEERREHGQLVYDKLLWALECITVCSAHKISLSHKCPSCVRETSVLSPRMRPGYCSRCLRWLGLSLPLRGHEKTDGKLEHITQQLWKAREIGDLLASAPSLSILPAKEILNRNLRLCIDQTAWGNINHFSRLVGVWHLRIRNLLGTYKPVRLELLSHICSQLNVHLSDLLSGVPSIVTPDTEGMLEQLRIHRHRSTPQRRSVSMTLSEIELELIKSLSERPPPSISEVSRRAGHHMSKLERSFPALYRKVVTRRREWQRKTPSDRKVEKRLREALAETPPLSLQSVFRQLGCSNTGYRYQRHLPELCKQVAARYLQSRNHPFNHAEAELALKAYLKENPPPSFSEVARRLGHKREFIITKLPLLSSAITERYLEYRRRCRIENKEALLREVRKAVRALTAEGLYPSEARIQSRLSRKWNSALFEQIIQQVKREMEIIVK